MILRCFIFSLVILISPLVLGAKPMVLHKAPLNTVKKVFEFPSSNFKMLAMNSKNSLHLVNKTVDTRQQSHIRMQQYFEGIPVFGGYAIIHSQEKPTLAASSNAVTGILYPDLEAELGPMNPSLKHNAGAALSKFKGQFTSQSCAEESVLPMVYMDDKNQAHWAYKLSVLLESTQGRAERPTAIVDAYTLQPFIQWDDVKTLNKNVKGMGFGGNTKTGKYQYGTDSPYLQITRDAEEFCYMQNKEVMVIDMDHQYSALKRAMKFPCPKKPELSEIIFSTGQHADGYDEINGAFSPTNDALHAGLVIKNMYRDWYQIPVLTKADGKTPMQLVMRVHYGDEYDNAYWDGRQMTFGDGDKEFYPFVSLGVAAHEISHGFTEQHSDLIYYGESGAMNESFSDMASKAVEFYFLGRNDWDIGSDVIKQENKALRYMDKPSKDGRSFDTASAYHTAVKEKPFLDRVHTASGVFNRLFYLLATQDDWDTHKAFDVMVTANRFYWGPYERFSTGACGLLYAAADIGYSVEDVKKALDGVAIDYGKCEE